MYSNQHYSPSNTSACIGATFCNRGLQQPWPELLLTCSNTSACSTSTCSAAAGSLRSTTRSALSRHAQRNHLGAASGNRGLLELTLLSFTITSACETHALHQALIHTAIGRRPATGSATHLHKHIRLLHQHLLCSGWLAQKHHTLPPKQHAHNLAMLPP
jgi:hypothetical protein